MGRHTAVKAKVKTKQQGQRTSRFHFKHWRIQSKILFGYLLVILLALISVFVGVSGINTLSKSNLPLLQETNSLDQTLSQMDLAMKNLLIIDQTNPSFYEAGTSEHFEQFVEFGALAQSKIKALSAHELLVDNPGVQTALSEMEANLASYQSNLIAIKELMIERGYDSTGLMSLLTAGARSVETAISSVPDSEKLNALFLSARLNERSYLLTNNKDYIPKMFDNLTALKAEVKALNLPENQTSSIENYINQYTTALNDVIIKEKALGSKTNEGRTYESQLSTQKLKISLENCLTLIQADIAAYTQKIFMMSLLSALALVVISIPFSLMTASIITKPVKGLNTMLNEIANGQGDLSQRLQLDSLEEMGTLAKLFNTFIEKIGTVVGNVKEDTIVLAHSTEEIDAAVASANGHINDIAGEIQDMSEGIQNTAAIIEETTASIQELSNSAGQISHEAAIVAENSSCVLAKSEQGVADLSTVVSSIQKVQETSKTLNTVFGDLKHSSSEIIAIVGLINAVAEQTSLLALNASIEAARAGEHGKGFAVVAGEVRKLSDESKVSAERISHIIKTITAQIEKASETITENEHLVLQSVSFTERTDLTFREILSLVGDVVYKIKVISESSLTQSHISEDMTRAVDELSKVVQSNAHMSERINLNIQGQVSTFEQIQASMSELNQLAKRLKIESDKFKI